MIILHNDETFHHLKSHTQTLVTPQLQDVPDTYKTKKCLPDTNISQDAFPLTSFYCSSPPHRRRTFAVNPRGSKEFRFQKIKNSTLFLLWPRPDACFGFDSCQ